MKQQPSQEPSGISDIARGKRHRSSVSPYRVCIRVPPPEDKLARAEYEALSYDQATRRQAWVGKVLGADGVYVGRPKNDGGWFQVPQVKHGSFLANPFPVKDYGLSKSLELYEVYLRTRLADDCRLESLIMKLPLKERKAATMYYVTDKGKGKGKSTKHYELHIFGKPFKTKVLALHGCKLGCFCDVTMPCHVDSILNIASELL